MSDIKDRRIAELEGMVQGLRGAFQSMQALIKKSAGQSKAFYTLDKITGICVGSLAASKHYRRGRPDRTSDYEGEKE